MNDRSNFQLAFDHYADQINLASPWRASFVEELFASHGSAKEHQVAEKWLEIAGGIDWPDGERFVREWKGEKGTFKQICRAFSGAVIGLYRHKEWLIRHGRSKESRPYLKVYRGPLRLPCPVHEDGHLFTWSSGYLHTSPFRELVFCRCTLISQRTQER